MSWQKSDFRFLDDNDEGALATAVLENQITLCDNCGELFVGSKLPRGHLKKCMSKSPKPPSAVNTQTGRSKPEYVTIGKLVWAVYPTVVRLSRLTPAEIDHATRERVETGNKQKVGRQLTKSPPGEKDDGANDLLTENYVNNDIDVDKSGANSLDIDYSDNDDFGEYSDVETNTADSPADCDLDVDLCNRQPDYNEEVSNCTKNEKSEIATENGSIVSETTDSDPTADKDLVRTRSSPCGYCGKTFRFARSRARHVANCERSFLSNAQVGKLSRSTDAAIAQYDDQYFTNAETDLSDDVDMTSTQKVRKDLIVPMNYGH